MYVIWKKSLSSSAFSLSIKLGSIVEALEKRKLAILLSIILQNVLHFSVAEFCVLTTTGGATKNTLTRGKSIMPEGSHR